MAPSLPATSLPTWRRWALVALALLYVIVLTGATVRLTGSGLGCPDWPSCHGTRPVPEIEYHGMIEFTNRLVALPTMLAVLGTFVASFALTPVRRDLRWASGLALAGVFLQIVWGGVTIYSELHPAVVSVHFIISIAIFVAATYSIFGAASTERPRTRSRADWLPVLVVPVLCLAVIVAGVLTTASGPHSGATPDEPVARLDIAEAAVTFHARLAYTFAGAVVVLTLFRRRTAAGLRDLGVLAALIAVQIGLGEYQYRNGLPWPVVLAHVATACAIWIATLWLVFCAAFARTPKPKERQA